MTFGSSQIAAAASSSRRQSATVSSRSATSNAASAYRRAPVSRPGISGARRRRSPSIDQPPGRASSVVGPTAGRRLQELLDEASLSLIGHVSPTTRPAASRARSATSARTSAIARTFSASISRGGPDAHPLQLLLGRRDVRVAGLLGDLLGAGQDVVRLATRLAEGRDPFSFRVLAIATSLLGVLKALSRSAPCDPRGSPTLA